MFNSKYRKKYYRWITHFIVDGFKRDMERQYRQIIALSEKEKEQPLYETIIFKNEVE